MGFSKEFLNSLPQSDVPLNEWMARLYEATAEDGTLNIFAPYEYLTTGVVECKMDWDIPKFEKVAEEVYAITDALKKIAPFHEQLDEGTDAATILDEALLEVNNTYLVELDVDDAELERVMELEARISHFEELEHAREAVAAGDEYSKALLELLEAEDMAPVTEEEEAELERIYQTLDTLAAQRVGESEYACNVLQGARRIYRLYSLGAPEIVIQHEINDFATTFILHRYATSTKYTTLSYEEEQLIDRPEE